MSPRRRARASAPAREFWRALVQYPDDVGAIVDRLAAAESRKRAGMVKRLVLEALAARGEWDLERNLPREDAEAMQGAAPADPRARPEPRRPDSLIGIVRPRPDSRARGTFYLLRDGSVHVDPLFVEALGLPRDAFSPFRHEDWTILAADGSPVPAMETPFARVRRGLYSAPQVLGGRYKDLPVIWMITEGRPTKSGGVIRYVSVSPGERPCATCDAVSCFTAACAHAAPPATSGRRAG